MVVFIRATSSSFQNCLKAEKQSRLKPAKKSQFAGCDPPAKAGGKRNRNVTLLAVRSVESGNAPSPGIPKGPTELRNHSMTQRPFQFRLRSIFILTAIVGVLLVFVRWLESEIVPVSIFLATAGVVLAGQVVLLKLLFPKPPRDDDERCSSDTASSSITATPRPNLTRHDGRLRIT
jgi:hypothetical protein